MKISNFEGSEENPNFQEDYFQPRVDYADEVIK